MTALILIALAGVWVACRRRTGSTASRPAAGSRSETKHRTAAEHLSDPASGLALGHALAQHHHVPFGDPLPHGHLGSPAALAFWAGMGSGVDDEDED